MDWLFQRANEIDDDRDFGIREEHSMLRRSTSRALAPLKGERRVRKERKEKREKTRQRQRTKQFRSYQATKALLMDSSIVSQARPAQPYAAAPILIAQDGLWNRVFCSAFGRTH